MATPHQHTPRHDPDESNRIQKYASCLITPMSKDTHGFHLAHVVDALLVGLLVFFAVILGDLLPSLLAGEFAYLTIAEITQRIPTAAIAFGLTFVFQWLRARGIDVLAAYKRFKEALP
jgi:hypothetical protein